jgi:dTMP kinase
MTYGYFVTLEGGEGAGKTTVAAALARRLAGSGRDVVLTREPGGSPRAEALRKVILSGFARQFGAPAEALLFAAARIDHLDTTIRPALARGAWVICDRFTDSTRAYQGIVGAVDLGLIAALEQVSVGPTRPDLTVILDLPAEVGLARAQARRPRSTVADRFEREGITYHRSLRQAFLDIAAQATERYIIVDATHSVDAIEAQIWETIRRRLLLLRPRPRASG